MTLEEAKEFINYNIKEGVYSPEDFEEMSDEELIEFAEYEEGKADDLANYNENR